MLILAYYDIAHKLTDCSSWGRLLKQSKDVNLYKFTAYQCTSSALKVRTLEKVNKRVLLHGS